MVSAIFDIIIAFCIVLLSSINIENYVFDWEFRQCMVENQSTSKNDVSVSIIFLFFNNAGHSVR